MHFSTLPLGIIKFDVERMCVIVSDGQNFGDDLRRLEDGFRRRRLGVLLRLVVLPLEKEYFLGRRVRPRQNSFLIGAAKRPRMAEKRFAPGFQE